MLWKIRVLDQILFAKCISKEKLKDYLENNLDITNAVVEIKALSIGDIEINKIAPEILVNLNREPLYSTGKSTHL